MCLDNIEWVLFRFNWLDFFTQKNTLLFFKNNTYTKKGKYLQIINIFLSDVGLFKQRNYHLQNVLSCIVLSFIIFNFVWNFIINEVM